MADFRLEVFYMVAKELSFTKAANQLFITQPAVTKHIKELEDRYKNKLFDRNGNKIKLTPAGELLLKHAENLQAIYRNVEFEMLALVQDQKGLLRLGASSTIAQYVIVPFIADFKNRFEQTKVLLINGNTQQIEKAILDKDIDIAIVEGHIKNQQISYTTFIKDEIVLVCSKTHPLAKKNEIEPQQILDQRFVLREQGSGTLEVIDHALKSVNLKLADLNVDIHLGSTEGIKAYLSFAPCLAFISIHAVAKELQDGELTVVDVKGLSIERYFYFIHLHGMQDGLSQAFLNFAVNSHNLK
ncbi:LysR family transcriptional regulator [Pedobacter punctiformis]|uniref:LysR family transcriptional regulator n=1 Tax=Pedobacter punctiformis TaxID=3004097 RepID=A0ABT4LB23_9SPHI|nr:LysR family transcriptional regulator [Pedobacter sp. HCMS5-2]MCZ4245104.1 LysR family transcriptional regulator [Pedobacter sp. HCMS5-2]